MSFNWVILLLTGFLKVIFSSGKHKIFIGCLFPGYSNDRFGFKAAIELATEMINNRSDILPDHEIVMSYQDTYGSVEYTTNYAAPKLNERPKKNYLHLLLGPARPKTIKAAYQAFSLNKVVELSYGPSSVEFQRRKYSGLYTNVPSTHAFNKVRLSLIRYFGWKRIAILLEYNNWIYTEAVRDLQKQINRNKLNITLITIEAFNRFTEGHPRLQLETLQKLDARIIVGEFSRRGALKVFCEAYKLNMVGSKYVWLLPDRMVEGWTFSPKSFPKHSNRTAADCNASQIIEAKDGFIVSNRVPIRQDNNETLSGLTPETFMDSMRRRHKNPKPYTSYAFDTVWAAALLFQRSLSYPRYRPENVKFQDSGARKQYATFLSKTQFEGMSGPHHFNRRERLGTVHIRQMRNVNGKAEFIQVGTFTSINTVESKMTLFESQLNKLWKDGKVPVDETTKERKVSTYSTLQLSVIGAFAVFGLLYSIFLLYFNIRKRNHKVIRMSSPMINNVVLLGCLFCYAFVLLLGIDSRFGDDHVFGILCNVRLYMLAIGFSLAFGALFSKTWRVYKIFNAHRAMKKKLMRDFHLILFVLVLVIIDVIFVTIWVYCDPLEMKEIIFDELKDDMRDLITIPVIKICECTYSSKLLGALYGYKAILLLFGVFLAWETRDVKIPALNDSKYIGMSVYNVVILSAIGATVFTILKKTLHYELLYALVSVAVLLSTTVTLTTVFAPKVYVYYMTPPKSQERIRDMDALQMNVRSGKQTDFCDVCKAYANPRDVKHKWIQTEDFEQVPKDAIIDDVHAGISDGSCGDEDDEQFFEDKRKKYDENGMGSQGNIEFQGYNDRHY